MERFHVVVSCPTCGVTARLVAFEPEDTDQSITWTDGYQEIAGVPPPQQIARCRACRTYYWTDAATPLRASSQQAATPMIDGLEEHDYYEAIERGVSHDQEHELVLRVLAWWSGNDRFRRNNTASRFPSDTLAIRNLERLIDLCDGGDHEILLTRVEGLRQLGRFNEASAALDGLCSDYALAGTRFASLIAARSRDLEILFD